MGIIHTVVRYICFYKEMIEILNNLNANQQIALISTGAALLGAIIGALATIVATWVNKKVQSSGKVSLFAKIVYSKKKTINRGDITEVKQKWGYSCKSQFGLMYVILVAFHVSSVMSIFMLML